MNECFLSATGKQISLEIQYIYLEGKKKMEIQVFKNSVLFLHMLYRASLLTCVKDNKSFVVKQHAKNHKKGIHNNNNDDDVIISIIKP